MKRKIIHYVLLYLFLVFPIFGESQTELSPIERDEIRLQQLNSGGLRSVSPVQVEAYQDGEVIELFVHNYSGEIQISIFPGSIYYVDEVPLNGYMAIDISSLPEGNEYILYIRVGDKEFQGVFRR